MIGIIGGGLAAAKLVEAYRDAGGTDAITIWSLDPHGPYHRPPLSKRLLRGEAEPDDALVHPAGWYAERDVDLRLGEEVRSLDDVQAETIVHRDRRPAAPARRGARPAHARRLARAAPPSGRRADGHGDRRRVHRLRGDGVADPARRAGDADRARPDGLRAAAGAAALGGAARHVSRARRRPAARKRARSRAADLVVAGIGVEPNVELARAAGLEVRSGVVVDERFQTARPGVYAIGDVAEFYDPLYRQHRRIEHWSNAAYHGTTLGRILAGEDARYDIVSAFFSEEFGKSFKAFGDTAGHDSTALEGDFGGDRSGAPVPEGSAT